MELHAPQGLLAVGREVLLRATVPVLGVCLGLQGLVTAYGGRVGRIEPAHGEVALAVYPWDVTVALERPMVETVDSTESHLVIWYSTCVAE